MSDNKRFFAMTALVWLCSITLMVAQTVKGRLVDAETDEPLIGASVMVAGTTVGTVTDIDGAFSLNSPQARPTLKITYVGYKDREWKVNKAGDQGIIKLTPDAVVLNDVVITSQVAVARKTPVAMSSVDPVFIEEKMGNQEFPEILKSTPGVHANKVGGGHGDSEIWMRGFDNTNIATMVNGVPMNDMENGTVYWSNWSGLYDVARTVQTQRGLGASKVSSPSVGGTINIITKSTEAKKGGFVSYTMGNDNASKLLFSVSSGVSEKGWSFTLLGGRSTGDGYVQGTDYDDYTYFASIAKRLNDKHQLTLTAFGAPQEHYQRSSNGALTIAGWQEVERKYGVKDYKYNASYGFDNNGQRRTSEYNVYHKPQISLNHTWEIDEKSSLSTSIYTSIGRGYGYSGQGNENFGYTYQSWYPGYRGTLYDTYRKSDGTFDYGAIQDINAASDFGSMMVMTKSKNFHDWYGLLSTYTTKLNPYIDFYGGIDFRYYKGTHTNQIVDLYDGEYFIDSTRSKISSANNINAANPQWVNEKLGVGDVVYRDYDSHVWNGGLFFQAEYSKDKLTAFVAGSASNTSYDRYDRLYYDKEHAQSPTLNFWGFTAKGGANYNINDFHNVFLNIGYISRAPKFSYGAFMTSTTSNAVNRDAKNEKIFSIEGGYGFRTSWLDAKVNVYYTKWLDKAMTKSGTLDDGSTYNMNMTGVDALHKGVELELKGHVNRWIELTGMLSLGDWKWDSNATGYAYNEAGQAITKAGTVTEVGAEDHASATINLKGIRVGGSAQTTAALGANVKLSKALKLGADWTFEGRNYAYYSLSGSNLTLGKETTVAEPWRVPEGSTIDVNGSYNFEIAGLKAVLSANVKNLLDYRYIAKAYNPSSGTATEENIYCFYNFGRTYSVRLKVNF